MQPPRNILVIRNDKLGDFMLAWPAFALLKKQYPDCKVSALVPEYTRPIAEICPWIDAILIDQKIPNTLEDIKQLTAKLKTQEFDAAITLFSESRTALCLWLAGIPVRVAPATKIAQILHNYRLTQRRSRSEKSEYEYNIDLIKYYINTNGDKPVAPQNAPFLVFDKVKISHIKNEFIKNNKIDYDKILIIIHPGSGGSAVNLSVNQYARLARSIQQKLNTHFIITAGPNELDASKQLAEAMSQVPHTLYHSVKGIVEFAAFINICDLFVSGSTGPLHMAGALNIATAAFYPTKRSATSLRWKTLNESSLALAFDLDKNISDKQLDTYVQKIVIFLQNQKINLTPG